VEAFRGVGDPLLDGHPAAGQSAVASLDPARGLGGVAAIRGLPPLPESADELRALATALGADETSLLLRERATERAVRTGDLGKARVVAFATHAIVAGDLAGLVEPALVLTPPTVVSEEDDGMLAASEAAQLRLDADIVVLSACNTAAADGTPGALGLSGLAKAFLYAGARSLLASHWAVYSEAATRLTTGMFAELSREPGLGHSEALRRAMLELVDSGHPLLSHPSYWAPFVVVGEGGALSPPRGP
jgi:CHAT domain-containing protein